MTKNLNRLIKEIFPYLQDKDTLVIQHDKRRGTVFVMVNRGDDTLAICEVDPGGKMLPSFLMDLANGMIQRMSS